jgi:hypothetical protein
MTDIRELNANEVDAVAGAGGSVLSVTPSNTNYARVNLFVPLLDKVSVNPQPMWQSAVAQLGLAR